MTPRAEWVGQSYFHIAVGGYLNHSAQEDGNTTSANNNVKCQGFYFG